MLKENKVRTCSIIYVYIYIYNYAEYTVYNIIQHVGYMGHVCVSSTVCT